VKAEVDAQPRDQHDRHDTDGAGRDAEPPQQPEHPQHRQHDADHPDDHVHEVAVGEPEDDEDKGQRRGQDQFDHLPEKVATVGVPGNAVHHEKVRIGSLAGAVIQRRGRVFGLRLADGGVQRDQHSPVGRGRLRAVVVRREKPHRAWVVRERLADQSLDFARARALERADLLVERGVSLARRARAHEVGDAHDAVFVERGPDRVVPVDRPLVAQARKQRFLREDVAVLVTDVHRLEGPCRVGVGLAVVLSDVLCFLDAVDIVERVGPGAGLTLRVDLRDARKHPGREQHHYQERDSRMGRDELDRVRQSVSYHRRAR